MVPFTVKSGAPLGESGAPDGESGALYGGSGALYGGMVPFTVEFFLENRPFSPRP